jgi:hypothetical protein
MGTAVVVFLPRLAGLVLLHVVQGLGMQKQTVHHVHHRDQLQQQRLSDAAAAKLNSREARVQ